MIKKKSTLSLIVAASLFCAIGYANTAPTCPSASDLKNAQYSTSLPTLGVSIFYLNGQPVVVSGATYLQAEIFLQTAIASYFPTAQVDTPIPNFSYYYCAYAPGNSNPPEQGDGMNISWIGGDANQANHALKEIVEK